MQASQTPTLVPLAFAANGTKNTIPEASQIGITPGAASLNDGFPPLTFTPVAAGGVPPAGADFNGVFNLITQTIRWKHAGGQFGYNSAFASDSNVGGYPRGALLLRSDQSGMWLNQTDNNATNPDTGGAGWSAAFMSGVVGQTRNLVMNIGTASATATLTADEIVVATALGGQKYVLGGFSKTINLATTGAGGMDTGTAPASGYVAVYAIYNPTTQTAALLGVNATAAVVPEVYGGANMPSGYTASALVSVRQTSSGSLFAASNQRDRKVSFPVLLQTLVAQASYAVNTIAGFIPKNARRMSGYIGSSVTATGVTVTLNIASDTNGMNAKQMSYGGGPNGMSTPFENLEITTPQQYAYQMTAPGGTFTAACPFAVSSYEF